MPHPRYAAWPPRRPHTPAPRIRITGVTADKDQEERKLEDVCILYGATVAMWHRDRGDDTNAVKSDLTPTLWRRIPEQELLDKSRLLRDLMQSILDTSATDAAEWGITGDAVASLTKESDEFLRVREVVSLKFLHQLPFVLRQRPSR